MQRMSRAQRIFVIYLLLKLQEPRIIKRIVRNYGGGIGKHGNDMHTTPSISDHGGLEGLLDDDHTQYLLADGSRAMTGDFDVGERDNAGIYIDNSFIKLDKTTQQLLFRNRLNNAWIAIRAKALNATEGWAALATGAYIRTLGTNAGSILFKSYEGGWNTVATMEDDYFALNRAGDITMLDQKMMTLGTYTDAQRPAAGTAGRIIFNTDDGMPNYDDGTDWRDINGNIT